MKLKEFQQVFKFIGMISQVGLMIIFSIGIGFGLGYYLDRIIGFKFILTPLFTIIGVAAGFWSVMRMLMELFKNSKKDD